MKAVKFAIAAVAMASASASLAENLMLYGSAGGTYFYYDADSIKRDGEFILVWEYWDHSKAKKISYRNSRARSKFDCLNETSTLLYSISYNADGSVYNSFNKPYNIMTPIVPNSVASALYDKICR